MQSIRYCGKTLYLSSVGVCVLHNVTATIILTRMTSEIRQCPDFRFDLVTHEHKTGCICRDFTQTFTHTNAHAPIHGSTLYELPELLQLQEETCFALSHRTLRATLPPNGRTDITIAWVGRFPAHAVMVSDQAATLVQRWSEVLEHRDDVCYRPTTVLTAAWGRLKHIKKTVASDIFRMSCWL